MRHEGRAYYVGLLKAAELQGATHQAVMEFQVVSDKRLPKIRAGRNLIVFYFRKNMEALMAGTERRKTDTGTMRISSAALTALDLLRYPQASGSIDSVATVLSDLGQTIDPEQLGKPLGVGGTAGRTAPGAPAGASRPRRPDGTHVGVVAGARIIALDRARPAGRYESPTSSLNRNGEIPDGGSLSGACRSLTNDPRAEHRRVGQSRSLDGRATDRAGPHHQPCPG